MTRASLGVWCLLEVLGKIIHPTERKGHEGIKGFRASLSSYGQCVLERGGGEWGEHSPSPH